MEKIEVVVIGAGVVGLAAAAELSGAGREVVLLEKESSFGQGTSSRNSEVIHAGIYYPQNSLKASLCVPGNRLLYDYCAARQVPHRRLGKVIVARDGSEAAQLEELKGKGEANGAANLRWMEQAELKEYEPAVQAVRALYSPDTGIVDSHQLMKALEQEARDNGALIVYGSELQAVDQGPDGYALTVNGEQNLRAAAVVNSAGLFADRVAAMAGIDLDRLNYRLHFCKGEYFSYTKRSFLNHLVYPVPEHDATGLGVHSVLDLAGGLKFGPNVEYVDRIDYTVDREHRRAFWESVRLLFPRVALEELAPDQAGIRPKLQGPGEGFRDFVIREETALGLPGWVNLIGIESPGLTACLAIARRVRELI